MTAELRPILIVFGGLPGTGKSTIARELARQHGAVHLCIDTIEQAMRSTVPPIVPVRDEGYRVSYAVAEDNLRLGRTVIADSVNPIAITREAWRDVAVRSRSDCLEVEVICSDVVEHRRRVETRISDIEGLKLPDWQAVVRREYEAWEPDLVIDTAILGPEDSVVTIRKALGRP